MSLEDLIEAHLAGQEPEVPTELGAEFRHAVAAHAALQYALGETITVQESILADRPPPALPEDYEVIRELGRGGMGVVYLVRQKSLGRLVAVKVLRPGEATFGRLVQRFLEEARHLARLRHPNIVSVHETGRAADEPYFTMDYVEGEPLSAILARERLAPVRALALLRQAAAGVHHAHAQGIIHRDLKPGNILVDADGRAYVTDFGLARDMAQTSKLTRSGEVMGTPAYMAPEQARGQTDLIGEATDVHGLGVILYEMLTGRPPYGSDAPANVLVRLLKEEPVAPRRLDRRIPRALETICLKALAKTPERRYPTVHAFQEDLRRFEAGEAVQARRPGPLVHAFRLARRTWKLAVAALVLVTLAVALRPRPLDRTPEQLVAAAEEQRAGGDYSGAIRIYRQALAKAPAEARRDILDRMVACCDAIDDDKSALEACRLVLQNDADVSFGRRDYLVAQAANAELRGLCPALQIRFIDDRNRPSLELARKRLRIFLDGAHGTAAERNEAETTLAEVEKALAKAPQAALPYVDQTEDLPQGTPAELLGKAKDTAAPPWQRGKAAFAAGIALEEARQNQAALAAYRQAYDLIRSVYPVYAGMTGNIPLSFTDRTVARKAPACALLEKVFGAVRRLDPAEPNALRGGLRLRFVGVKIPASVSLWPIVLLWEPAVKDFPRNQEPYNCRFVPVQLDQTAWVGVADGRYRLALRTGDRSWDPRAGEETRRIAQLLELDGDSLPVVEVRGDVKEVPVPLRLSAEIKLLAPGPSAACDLQKDVFRWTAVAGADRYQVAFDVIHETAQGSVVDWQREVSAPSASLCLAALPAKDVGGWKDHLVAGRTGRWKVEAFDAAGRRIGVSLGNDQPFLVARGLEEK